ncbi:hypothetical protein [Acinetobacter tandoii]|uniref:Uncharacterized protein n=1 Tax=Acinetobacter tandoii DSM 14970 = CIP 107469 TaxID=1120927 RepID=R9AY15_9GAMM|nr:hypothetical protein [Acinetobacter tandoii]EOR05006.1 hypothetical protein I593_03090 [Acinetobacter tandoii DSM 14970 = CIP 107469]
MNTKTDTHLKFEEAMVCDLKDFTWNDELELYEDEKTQLCWLTWVTCESQPQTLKNDCMINQTWFMKGSLVAALIKHAEKVYQAEAVTQNSKIEFGTDDNEHWFAHDVPFFGRVQIDRIEEHGLVEWDIVLDGCWQGPFESKARCIQHLEDCIKEKCEEGLEG